MSSDEEDDLCRFGTPLDPIEEDEVPTTKKITLADQIAVDSNGRRRFHGAFTGGFAAGFWNTVGSREGWTPSEFKSSRGEKAAHRVQQPADFMDDEDVGEFGIAPQRIQTTEDFGPSTDDRQKNKRKFQSNATDGPIPGVPVLEIVLESCRDKAAVRLLKRMDKKYAATLNERPKKSTTKTIEQVEPTATAATIDSTEDSSSVMDTAQSTSDEKVYKCDMGPIQRPVRSDSTDSDTSFSDDDENLFFDADEFDSIFDNLKVNRFGLSYVGLDKGNFFTTVGAEAPIIQNDYKILPTFTMVDQNRKKVTIRGQAFGVGAFEEDDDDIYGRDDMTKYDFRLDNQIESQSTSNRLKAMTHGFINGFSEATKCGGGRITTKNVFKIKLPFGYEPRNWLKRKSRFGPEVIASTSTALIKGPSDKVIGRHDLTPDQRGHMLGDKKSDSATELDEKLKAIGLKPMSFTSSAIENTTNDEPNKATDNFSTKIDETLSKFRNKTFVVPESIPQIFDRFTASNDSKPLSELDPSEIKTEKDNLPVAPVKKEIQNVKRTKCTWVPCQLLCYKMNMETSVGTKPEKGQTFSLFECIANSESARRNRLEFTSVRHDDKSEEKLSHSKQPNPTNEAESVLSNQPKAKANPLSTIVSTAPAVELKSIAENERIESKTESSVAKRNKPKTELEMKIIDAQNEHPSKKKDIFKAIFDSDSGSDDSENDDDHMDKNVSNDVLETLTKPSSTASGASAMLYSQLPDEAFRPKSAREINILRNTSPPRGIFSGLLKKPETSTIETKSDAEPSTSAESVSETPDIYGPSLPPSTQKRSSLNNGNATTNLPTPSSSNVAIASITLGKHSACKIIYEEKWIEKSDNKEKKSKKEKKHKKDRDKHKSKKQKKEKHKKKKN